VLTVDATFISCDYRGIFRRDYARHSDTEFGYYDIGFGDGF